MSNQFDSNWLLQFQARAMKNVPASSDGVERESDLHAQIIAECKRRQWIYFHGSMAHKAMRTLGEPDFTVLADNGRVFFVEAKSKIGKLSPEQLGLRLWAEKLGHTIHEVRSFEQFLEVVNSLSTKSCNQNSASPSPRDTPNDQPPLAP